MTRSMTRLALGIMVSLAAASATRATTKTWNGGTNNFAQPGLWNPFGVPGAADQAFFSAGGAGTVTFSNSPFPLPNPVLNQDLNITGGNVTFTSGSGGPYTYRLTGSGGDDANINNGTLTLGAMGSPLHMTIDDDLVVRGGTTLNVRFGSVVNTLDLLLAQDGGSGGIFVDGTGSQLNVSNAATQSLGLGGGTATLSFNGSSGSFSGPLAVGVSNDAGTVGVLNVQTGAQVNIANLSVGSGTAAATTGTVNGSGSTLVQSGASTLTVGAASGGSGAINIGVNPTGGTLTTGSGLFTINKTGTVSVGSPTAAGTLNANGDVTIDGGVLQVLNSGSNFLLAAGKTFTVQNGGRATSYVSYTTSPNAVYNIQGIIGFTGATWEFLADAKLNIANGAQVNVGVNSHISGVVDIGGIFENSTPGTLNIGTTAGGGSQTGGMNIYKTGTVNFGSTTIRSFNGIGLGVNVDGGVLRVFGPLRPFGIFDSLDFIVQNGGRATFDLDGGNHNIFGMVRVVGANSKWEFVNGSGLIVGPTATVFVYDALLTVDGDVVVSGTLDLNLDGIAHGRRRRSHKL